MNVDRLLTVLTATIPVFALIGLGKLLERKGILTTDRREFINFVVFRFSLPALIFTEVSQQRFSSLWNGALIAAPLAAIAVAAPAFVAFARLLRFRGVFAAAFVYGTFWANVSYLGFPLAENALGANGLALAAVYNAFVMPVFIVLAYVLIALYGGGDSARPGAVLRTIVGNPIIGSVFLGIVAALAADRYRAFAGTSAVPPVLESIRGAVYSFLGLLGRMGLPLALVGIGGALHLPRSREHRSALILAVGGKLLLLPLLTLMVLSFLFPQAASSVNAIAVLMSSMPLAVAGYVVGRNIGVDEGFMASLLVLSTAISMVTVPIWLYFVL